MGLTGLSAYSMNTLFDNIIEKRILHKNTFSFVFNPVDGSDTSKLIFGEPDTKQCQSPLKYYDVVSDKYWIIEIDNILVDS